LEPDEIRGARPWEWSHDDQMAVAADVVVGARRLPADGDRCRRRRRKISPPVRILAARPDRAPDRDRTRARRNHAAYRSAIRDGGIVGRPAAWPFPVRMALARRACRVLSTLPRTKSADR